MPHTTFEYLYCDASNYKSWGGVILVGCLSQGDEILIRQKFESGEFFIAEQIGVPALQSNLWKFSNSQPNTDDHAWHRVHDLRATTADDFNNFSIWGDVTDFVWQFSQVKQWDITLSPSCAVLQT